VVADLQQYFDDNFGLEVGVLEMFGNIRGVQVTQDVDVVVNCAFGRLFAYKLGTKGRGHCASFTSLGPRKGPRREGAKARVSASRLVVKGSSRLENGWRAAGILHFCGQLAGVGGRDYRQAPCRP
jgi:hypothetical protein